MVNKINTRYSRTVKSQYATAFTLIELLIVMAIISLLAGILIPVLNITRSRGRQMLCESNIRQLLIANTSYAGDNEGGYVPAASDIFTTNRQRWYGLRDNINSPFDTTRGPLASHCGGGKLKCSAKVNFVKMEPAEPQYDQGSSGYGYNMIYIGSRIWINGYEDSSCKITAKASQVTHPARTLMFADVAMHKQGNYIEYSFAEPRYFVINGNPDPAWDPSPSIHFRHRGRANIGWADGHVGSEKMAPYNGLYPNGFKAANMDLGWFKPMDNSLFDLK